MDCQMMEVQRQLSEMAGVPFTSFDGDQADYRNYSEAQFETCLLYTSFLDFHCGPPFQLSSIRFCVPAFKKFLAVPALWGDIQKNWDHSYCISIRAAMALSLIHI